MLRHTGKEESAHSTQPYVPQYVPVPRKDEMSEAHLEDYLDHFCVPLVGKISYEERAKMREELRSQIESVIAAHIELGVTREQAIALTLQQFSHVPAVAPLPTISHRNADTAAAIAALPRRATKRRYTALKSFGLTTAISFLTLVSMGEVHDATIPVVFLAVLPFLAGLNLGYRQPDRPLRSMLKALAWLSPPTLVLSWIYASAVSSGNPIEAGLGATMTYLAWSCLVGGAGTKIGTWARKTGFLDKVDPPGPARLEEGPYRMP